MLNDRRRLWTSIIFIGLFAPFVALALLNMLTNRKSVIPAAVPASAAGGGSVTSTSAPAPTPSTAGIGDFALLAAGDGHDLWVMQPATGENKELGFLLLQRAPNTGVWHAALHTGPGGGPVAFWNTPTMPRALAVMRTPPDHLGQSSPYLLGEAKSDAGAAPPPGWVSRYYLDRDPSYVDYLPAGHTIKASTGGVDQLFVVTLGAPVAARLGEPVRADRVTPATSAAGTSSAPASAPSTPATTAASGTAPATEGAGVATASSAPAPENAQPLQLNIYWFPPMPAKSPVLAGQLNPAKGQWCVLTALGTPTEDSREVPRSSSPMALLEQDGRLMAFWVGTDPSKSPSVIMVRTLDYMNQGQKWSPSRAISLGEEIQPPSRLFAFTLDHTIYLLWAVPTAGSYALHGGWVRVPETGDAVFHAIAPMPLDAAGTGISVNDLAVGPSENSIVAVVSNHDDGMKSLVFDSNGQLRQGATSVNPESPRHDVQVGQNIAMVLLVLMLVLALWQWRQKQPPLVLPTGTVVAPLHLRALAFGIDAVLPYVAVYFILHNGESYMGMLTNWIGLLANPEELVKSMDLWLFLGIYLAHVTVGELFFRRSLGKAAAGLQVVMADGKKPTVGAILVRNLVRVPECVMGVVVVYLVMSDRRQRLGDMLARTVVVAPQGEPETGKKG